ncbi:hypothetical protein P171DRAFT_429037 [Karstenula rhodostoma CBS 690.94]|uniref:Uncharacterized protein n=1 Tax=Karstenula rhodostoma CBS 690.94 TaxID=1392251 RepID=A0A9P4PNR7_9PLEO|nr:hypothetical protein P171DRAFT_429037 [Karstenula rhodostoma CBS 690.94]
MHPGILASWSLSPGRRGPLAQARPLQPELQHHHASALSAIRIRIRIHTHTHTHTPAHTLALRPSLLRAAALPCQLRPSPPAARTLPSNSLRHGLLSLPAPTQHLPSRHKPHAPGALSETTVWQLPLDRLSAQLQTTLRRSSAHNPPSRGAGVALCPSTAPQRSLPLSCPPRPAKPQQHPFAPRPTTQAAKQGKPSRVAA